MYTVTITPRGSQAVALQVHGREHAMNLIGYLLENLEPSSLAHLTVAPDTEMPRTGSQRPVEAPLAVETAPSTPEPENASEPLKEPLVYRCVPLIDGEPSSLIVGPKGCTCKASVFRGTPCIHYANYEKGRYEADTSLYPRTTESGFMAAREKARSQP